MDFQSWFAKMKIMFLIVSKPQEVFDITTVAYVLRPEFVLNHNTIFDGTLRHVVVPHERAIDIDNQFDFDLAEFYLQKRSAKGILMKEIRLEPRSCECCGSNNSEDVWNSSSVVARAKNKWKFPYHISICQDCGFTYASPAPTEEDLLEYHTEGLTGYKNIPLPYSIERGYLLLRDTQQKMESLLRLVEIFQKSSINIYPKFSKI